MTDLELELAKLLVSELQLEDVVAEQIDPEEQLFGTGLALDSIDALELAVAIHKQYGVRIDPDDAEQRSAMATLRALAGYVQRHS